MKSLQESGECCTFAPQFAKGRLAQLVQSVCLTSRGSGVRIPQRPQNREQDLMVLLPFFCLSAVSLASQPALPCYLGAWVPFVALPTRPSPSVSLIKDLCLVARRPTWRFLMGQWLPYSSPNSRLMSCSSARMDCRRPMISDVSLAALWFLFSTAFAAAIFMPRTLSRL